ncbi:MAG: Gfo/Idh/MocA family oxidoreductase [Armatimonadota bacterium]|nr:Gfo/Idh/MocA family oxidoreductase [bacterium]
MKAAVIGAGMWGKNIVRTLNSMDSLDCVAELDAGLRSGLAQTYPGLTIHDTIDPVMESDVPAVCIAVPAPWHYEIAKKALERGKDVFVEKPMTLSVDDAQDLVRIARERERILMVGHLLLYQPAVQWIKEAISSGMIGELKSIHQRRLDLGRARDVENVLWSLGVHDVAVALFLIGKKPESIEIQGQRVLQPTIEDDVHVEMTFPGGVKNYLHCSWLWPVKDRGMMVIGSEGMLVYNELEQNVTLHRKTIGSDLKNVDNGSEVVYEGSGQPLTLELTHFLECCAQRKTPMSGGESGVEVIKVLQTASERFNS